MRNRIEIEVEKEKPKTTPKPNFPAQTHLSPRGPDLSSGPLALFPAGPSRRSGPRRRPVSPPAPLTLHGSAHPAPISTPHSSLTPHSPGSTHQPLPRAHTALAHGTYPSAPCCALSRAPAARSLRPRPPGPTRQHRSAAAPRSSATQHFSRASAPRPTRQDASPPHARRPSR